MQEEEDTRKIELMTLKEVAAALKRSVRTVELMRESDRSFPLPIRWGKKNYWRKVDLVAWLDAQFETIGKQNAERLTQITKGCAD